MISPGRLLLRQGPSRGKNDDRKERDRKTGARGEATGRAKRKRKRRKELNSESQTPKLLHERRANVLSLRSTGSPTYALFRSPGKS